MQNLGCYSRKEVTDALTIIKTICELNDCLFCPFHDTLMRQCSFSAYSPSNAKIVKPEEPAIWRAVM